MNDWREMFEQRRNGAITPVAPPASNDREASDDVAPAPDPKVYQPWLLQRGRGRPALFLDLRRFEPRTGMLIGCQMGYPYLAAIDYIGDRMLSLDFGTRHFVIEGDGLGELLPFLQQGIVLAIQEYSPKMWAVKPEGPVVAKIVQIATEAAATIPSISGRAADGS